MSVSRPGRPRPPAGVLRRWLAPQLALDPGERRHRGGDRLARPAGVVLRHPRGEGHDRRRQERLRVEDVDQVLDAQGGPGRRRARSPTTTPVSACAPSGTSTRAPHERDRQAVGHAIGQQVRAREPGRRRTRGGKRGIGLIAESVTLQERIGPSSCPPTPRACGRGCAAGRPDGRSESASRRRTCRRGRAGARSDSGVLSSVCAANVPSATITFGRIDVDLPEQERLARGDLVRLGVAVLGRAALDDVGDVDVVARRSRSPRSSSSAAARRGRRTESPCMSSSRARRLADEHQLGAADCPTPNTICRRPSVCSLQRVQSPRSARIREVRRDSAAPAGPAGLAGRRPGRDRRPRARSRCARASRVAATPATPSLGRGTSGVRPARDAGRIIATASAPAAASSSASTRSRIARGDVGLRLQRQRPRAVLGRTSVTALVSTSKPASVRDTSLATIRSTCLRRALLRARRATTSPVSAAKPTSTACRAAPPRAARRARPGCPASASARASAPRASFAIFSRRAAPACSRRRRPP